MTQPYKLQIVRSEGNKQIDFANKTSDFVEVIFTIDHKDVREGKPFNPLMRGYCYPSDHHKPIRSMIDGAPLPFGKRGIVRAYVFEGKGRYKGDEDIEVPTFIRRKLYGKKVTFRRTSNEPVAVLETTY